MEIQKNHLIIIILGFFVWNCYLTMKKTSVDIEGFSDKLTSVKGNMVVDGDITINGKAHIKGEGLRIKGWRYYPHSGGNMHIGYSKTEEYNKDTNYKISLHTGEGININNNTIYKAKKISGDVNIDGKLSVQKTLDINLSKSEEKNLIRAFLNDNSYWFMNQYVENDGETSDKFSGKIGIFINNDKAKKIDAHHKHFSVGNLPVIENIQSNLNIKGKLAVNTGKGKHRDLIKANLHNGSYWFMNQNVDKDGNSLQNPAGKIGIYNMGDKSKNINAQHKHFSVGNLPVIPNIKGDVSIDGDLRIKNILEINTSKSDEKNILKGHLNNNSYWFMNQYPTDEDKKQQDTEAEGKIGIYNNKEGHQLFEVGNSPIIKNINNDINIKGNMDVDGYATIDSLN